MAWDIERLTALSPDYRWTLDAVRERNGQVHA